MKNKGFLLFQFFLVGFILSVQAQNSVKQLGVQKYIGLGESIKKDGRFSVNILGSKSTNAIGNGNTSLLESIDLNIQWWTLLGEPLEYYDIRWTAKDNYKIDSRYVYRNKLEKYPDLLKRFDNLRPTKLSIQIVGDYNFNNEVEVSVNPSSELTPFYGKDRMGLSSGNNLLDDDKFSYTIRDGLLLISKSGVIGEGIIPNSPEKWENFLQYQTFTIGPFPASNDYINGFDKLSESKRKKRRKQLQTIFQKAQSIELSASVRYIEWPEDEMRTIAELYEKYENGEEELSPIEEVEQLMKEEVESLKKTSQDDFWDTPVIALEPDLEIIQRKDKRSTSYYYGVYNHTTTKFVIEPNRNLGKHNLKIIFGKFIIVESENYPAESCTGPNQKGVAIFDHFGNKIVDKNYSNVVSVDEDTLRVATYKDCFGSNYDFKGYVSYYDVYNNQMEKINSYQETKEPYNVEPLIIYEKN